MRQEKTERSLVGKIERPSWRLPPLVSVLSALAGIVVGWLGLVILWAGAPTWLTVGLLLIALISTAKVVIWVTANAVREAITVGRRLIVYDRLHEAYVVAIGRIHDMTRELASHAISPGLTRTTVYDIMYAHLRNGEIFVTLDETDKSPLKPGTRLTVIDEEDGLVQAMLEVTSDRTSSGRYYGRLFSPNGVFLSVLYQHAERRTRLDLRAKAIVTITEDEGSSTDESSGGRRSLRSLRRWWTGN